MDRIDIDKPRYDQSTYWGRVRHFFFVANPMNLFATPAQLDHAKDIVQRYRKGEKMDISEEELWNAKNLYDSAFHPETGEKQLAVGRMSAQVPMNMLITGAMLTFYKTSKEVIFWQWFNQSFNAVVNYSNRSGDSPLSKAEMGTSYVSATAGALVTSLGLNSLVKSAPAILGRLVPFTAVAAANAVNIPLVRKKEIIDGMKITDENGNVLGHSSKTAKLAISQVVLSRVSMAVPTMVGIPFLMNSLEKKGYLKKYPRLSLPLQIGLCGILLTFATPLCCAIFPQTASVSVDFLEEDLQKKIKSSPNPPTRVYYNKGL